MNLYSKNDKNIIDNNIDKIKKKSEVEQLKTINPDINQIKLHFQTILEFVKSKDIIIYGGYGIHLYLNETLYDIESCIPDIDLYSSDPVNDIIEITHILKQKYKIENIEAKEALHKGTFSLFVEYRNYIDLTYIPKEIYDKIKIKKYKNLKVFHPSLILFDLIKKFNDPLFSYWKLEKDFKRFYILNDIHKISDYFETNFKIKNRLNYLNKNITDLIENNINNDSMIITGSYCYQLFLDKNTFHNIPFFEIISVNYSKDVLFFYHLFQKHFKKIYKVHYSRFFNFLNEKTIFYKDNKIILIIYDNYKKCIPFIKNKNKNFSSYLYLVQIIFYNYIYYDYSEQYILRDYTKNLFENLLVLKRNFFQKHTNQTILDNTIYQQFSIDCLGERCSPLVQFIKNTNEKYQKKKFKKFLYRPSKNTIKKKIKFMYDKIDGKPIIKYSK